MNYSIIIFKRFAHNNFFGEGLCHPQLVIISFILLFFTLHSSLLHKRSLCAKFDSIIHCIVVEGVSMDCYNICYIVVVADLFTSSRLDFLVVLGTPLFFLRLFLLITNIFDNLARNSRPFF